MRTRKGMIAEIKNAANSIAIGNDDYFAKRVRMVIQLCEEALGLFGEFQSPGRIGQRRNRYF